MQELFAHLQNGFRNHTSMDITHASLIAATVLSLKPARVLELGIGTGYLSRALVLALRSNGRGTLTCVDNWYDWNGHRPPHISEIEAFGATVVCSSEESFVRSSAREQFDVVISDADHFNSHQWFEGTLSLVAPGGIAFFHDTNQPHAFPNLTPLPRRAAELGLPSRHFTASSDGDGCARGLLMVWK